MIKVLERRELTRFQVNCNKCRSLLEYDCTDVYTVSHEHCYGSYDTYHIDCPVCKHMVDVRMPTV